MQDFANAQVLRCWRSYAVNCLNHHRFAVRCMKLTGILLLVFCIQVGATGFSQTVSLSLKKAPLEQVFHAIEQQTNYVFFFNVELMRKAGRVTVEVKQMTVNDVLERIFKDLPITYSFEGKMITIGEKKNHNKDILGSENVTQLIDVKGQVVNEEGEPIAGVSVQVKGSKIGTSSDANGEFILKKIESDAILILSAVNIMPVETPLTGQKNIIIRVKGKTGVLDQVQVIAYGTTSQRLNTGNVSTVKAEDIEKSPVTNPLLTLQGRVPGLFIMQTTGLANGNVTVRIQGQNSIGLATPGSSNEPLIIVDNVPYPSVLPRDIASPISGGSAKLGGSPLSFINPSDIESIDVLKDADATAIYGSRAANGAILITTKRGKAGKMKIDVNLQQGWGRIARKVDMLNSRQYLDMRYEALKNDNVDLSNISATNVNYLDLKQWDTTRYTDWQRTLLGERALYTNFNVTLSGGTNNIQYLIGCTYNRTTDVFPGNLADKRGSVHFSLNGQSANQKLRIQMVGSYMADNNQLPGVDLTRNALFLEPVAPRLYNDDGTLNGYALTSTGVYTWENPLIPIFLRIFNHATKNLLANAQLSYSILPALDVKCNFGYSNLQSDGYSGTPFEAIRPDQRSFVQRSSRFSYRTMSNWIVEPQLTYNNNYGKLNVGALFGITVQQNSSELVSISGQGYNNDLLLKNIAFATTVAGSTLSVPYKYNAGFTRINLNWDNKYILNLTGRRDGSSRFGENNRFHNFGSIGTAWLFREEPFFRNRLRFVSFGKLRASVGTTGNDQIGDYAYLSSYSNYSVGIPYQNVSSINISGLTNPYIEWEETKKWQLGMDIGFLKDRVLLNVTYGLNRSSNQLLNYSLPDIVGSTGILTNFPATVQNTSWEVVLTTTNFKDKSFSWNTSFNMTFPRNELISFPDIENSAYSSGNDGVIVGKPLGVIKIYKYLGVDPATGFYQLEDFHGNATSSPSFDSDRTKRVSLLPKYYGGVQNNISYKNFQISFLFQFVKQLGPVLLPYSSSIQPGSFARGISNQSSEVLNRWQKEGDISQVAKFNSNRTLIVWASASDAGYSYDASYIRLKNVSLSWNMPKQWIKAAHLTNGQIYFQGQNLYTITKFSGLDPENQSLSSLPPLEMWTVGIKFGF